MDVPFKFGGFIAAAISSFCTIESRYQTKSDLIIDTNGAQALLQLHQKEVGKYQTQELNVGNVQNVFSKLILLVDSIQ